MSRTSTSRSSEKTSFRSVDIHRPEQSKDVDIEGIVSFLEHYFPTIKFRTRPSIVASVRKKGIERISERFASARMKDPNKAEQSFEPMYGEIDYERRVIVGEARIGGIVYDGRRLDDLFTTILGPQDLREHASIILTDRLVSTYSTDDLRHHLRTIVCGFPSIVSLPGIVEAPAKPREYYLLRQSMELQGAGEAQLQELKTAFKGRFIDYDSTENTEVLKGLALQGVLFHLTLQPFCNNRDCRLFNAHWQEDLIRSQITSAKMCANHKKIVQKLGKEPAVNW
jgi:hypothetical protein